MSSPKQFKLIVPALFGIIVFSLLASFVPLSSEQCLSSLTLPLVLGEGVFPFPVGTSPIL